MLLEHVSLLEEAALVRKAVDESIRGLIRTADIQVKDAKPYSTDEVGTWIVQRIKDEC